MKFLGFKWPTHNDIQIVEKKFILYRPVQLNGNLPFHISGNKRDNHNVQKL